MKKVMVAGIVVGLLSAAINVYGSGKERTRIVDPTKTVIGLTVHYSPTAGSFVRGNIDWMYVQDTASIGLFLKAPLSKFGDSLSLKSRLIIGAGEMSGDSFIGPVGTICELGLCLADFVYAKYECQYYWGNETASPVYNMAIGISHKVQFDVNIPMFQF